HSSACGAANRCHWPTPVPSASGLRDPSLAEPTRSGDRWRRWHSRTTVVAARANDANRFQSRSTDFLHADGVTEMKLTDGNAQQSDIGGGTDREAAQFTCTADAGGGCGRDASQYFGKCEVEVQQLAG